MMEEDTTREFAMRDEPAFWPESEEALVDYIRKQVEGPHTYGTCVYAMSNSAVATFNYVSHILGVTGFQASCADMDILRRTRNFEAGMIINFDDLLYPQYDLHQKLQKAMDDARLWLKEQAQKQIDNADYPVHPDVMSHWETLAAWEEEAR